MNNRKAGKTIFINSTLLRKLASLTLAFFVLIGPAVPLFAQEVTETTPAPVETTTPEPVVESPLPEPEQTIEVLPEEEQPQIETPSVEEPEAEVKEEKEEEPVPEEMAALGAGSLPNSPREVLQSSRDRISSEIDTLTGALLYKYKIAVPPGRNSTTTPSVSLSYNSADANRDSIIGSGWSVNIPYIERINKTGTQNLYSEDYYVSSLSGELISMGSGAYGPKVETGEFLKYTKNANGWTVLDKNGTLYTFGLTAQARQDNSADTTKIYRWALEEIRDTNNNYISYEYYKDAGQIYPSKITYTGNNVTAGVMTVNFVRQARTGAPKQYSTGFSVQANYRISEIRTEVNTVWARKYTLAYTTADNGTTSLLNTIVESGQDDSAVTTTLPAIDFDYQTSTVGWTYNSTFNMPIEVFQTTDKGARIGDINADGLQDVVCSGAYVGTPCGGSPNNVYVNNGAGWTYDWTTWTFPAPFVDNANNDTGARLVDVNGDNILDFAQARDTTVNKIYIGNASTWTLDTNWSIPLPFVDTVDYGMRMADINGDNLPDILCSSDRTTTGSTYCRIGDDKVYLNNGTGWTQTTTTFQLPAKQSDPTKKESFTDSTGNDNGLRIIDVNGDGLADLVRAVANTRYFYINTGSSFVYDSTWNTLPAPFVNTNSKDLGARMADFNGDGYIDFICKNEVTSEYCGVTGGAEKGINTGTGFAATTWTPPNSQLPPNNPEAFTSNTYMDKGVRLFDVNGDTLPDLVRADSSTSKFTYLNNTTRQTNYLTKITYPEGGNTTVTYKPTTLYRDGSNNLMNPNLPISNTVVSQITDNDGVTPVTHTYEYWGGRYYFSTSLDRRFAGFSKIVDTDSAGNVKKTYFHQGNTTDTTNGEYDDHVSKIGKPYRVEEYDNTGNLYALTVSKWDKFNLGTNRDFVKLIRETKLAYDGNAGHKDTSVEYTYDNANGSILTQSEWGEVTGATDGSFTDTGTDKRTTTNLYATNATTKVTVPYNSTVTNQSVVKVKEDKYYYDTLAYGSVTKGNPTKVEQWKTASTYINSQKSYNATYGTVATETDPRGKVTTYTTYDTYNIYPITVTNPLSQTTQYVYDYSLGKPKQVTDQNSFVYKTVYDGLDRITAVQIPDFSTPYSAINKTVFAYTDTSGAVKVQKTDYLDSTTSADTYLYYDGLGRLIQDRKEAETANTFNVRDVVYNNLGLIQKQSLRYTSTGTAKTSPTVTTSLYTSFTYDPLGRLLTQVDAIGTTSYAYDDWKTTVTDRNSKVKKYYKDAYDNLIKVDEVNGASTYTSNYEWNLLGKLTKITDASSNLRNFTYDGLGRRLTAQDLHTSADATFGTWTYTYDDAGNITQTISPRSLTTNYTYNDINQILTEDTTGVAGTEITYTYSGCTNGTGKLCTVTMTTGANSAYTYDSNSNIASDVKTINTTPYTTSYTYDRQGNVLIITYPDNAQVKYGYNTAGLLEKVEQKESGGSFAYVIVNFNYSPMDQITAQSYPNTVATTNSYDATKLYRLTRRVTQNTVPTKFIDLNYTYDNENNITVISDISNTSTSKTANYVYDDLYRMTSATITNVAAGQSTYTHTFTYDALGNILTGPIGTYLYQGNTGILTANPHAATSINAVTYTYDADGNLTGNGTLANTWNYKNQLTQTIVGGVTINDYYDHDGNRVWHKVGTASTYYPNKFYIIDSAGKKTKQVYAGDQLVGTIETVGAVVTPYYNHTDHLNSITAVTNSAGTSVETLDYFPYGNQRISTGSYTGQRQYIGQVYDVNTNLDYLNARYYKADIGKFINEDPVFWEVDQTKDGKQILLDPQLQNSYSYGRNNPITLSDPNGQMPFSEFAASRPEFSAEYVQSTDYNELPYFYRQTGDPANAARINNQRIQTNMTVAFQFALLKAGSEAPKSAAVIPDNALVVRGGGLNNQSVLKINESIRNSLAKGVNGFSVQCSSTCTSFEQLGELGKFLRNKDLAVTRAGEIRRAGGTVTNTPGYGEHATVFNLPGEKASALFRKILKNPNPRK